MAEFEIESRINKFFKCLSSLEKLVGIRNHADIFILAAKNDKGRINIYMTADKYTYW